MIIILSVIVLLSIMLNIRLMIRVNINDNDLNDLTKIVQELWEDDKNK